MWQQAVVAGKDDRSPTTMKGFSDMVAEWFVSLRADAECHLQWMPLRQSAEWSLRDGAIAHRSSGFFKVVGLQWTSPSGDRVAHPFLAQEEIGTLGFLMRVRDGRHQLLLQGKIEPGNVGLAQLAPTCQATESNARQLHGGAPPPFISDFEPDAREALYDVLQSEQGSRFLRKRNRNVLTLASGDEPLPRTHRWLDVDVVLGLLWRDYFVNTDARSVLVCSPWHLLVNRVPFSLHEDGFGHELFASMNTSSRHGHLETVKERVRLLRLATEQPKTVNLEELPQWHWTDEGFAPLAGSSLRVRHLGAAVRGREVPRWDQPIIDSGSDGSVLLVCARTDGILHFLFRLQPEPGLRSRVELTATVVVEPGDLSGTGLGRWGGRVVAQCRQSEEGGRFYRDTNSYQLVDAGVAGEGGANFCWLTLGDVRELLNESGWLTNEARSVLSLLLPWM